MTDRRVPGTRAASASTYTCRIPGCGHQVSATSPQECPRHGDTMELERGTGRR